MTRMMVTDDPTRRVGAIMHNVRQIVHMARGELAELLNMTPGELAAYEHGRVQIPPYVLEHVFVLSCIMLRMRKLKTKYRMQRRAFRKIKQTVADVP